MHFERTKIQKIRHAGKRLLENLHYESTFSLTSSILVLVTFKILN